MHMFLRHVHNLRPARGTEDVSTHHDIQDRITTRAIITPTRALHHDENYVTKFGVNLLNPKATECNTTTTRTWTTQITLHPL